MLVSAGIFNFFFLNYVGRNPIYCFLSVNVIMVFSGINNYVLFPFFSVTYMK